LTYVYLNSRFENGRGFVQRSPIGINGRRDVQNLANGVSVGPSLTASYAWGSGEQQLRDILIGSQLGRPTKGFVFGDNFIGFRFDASGTTLYGWARITLELLSSNPQGQASLTIAEWAYEDSGAAIHLADTGAQGVDEPASLALLALGAGGLAAWRRRRSRATAEA
jgi:hypothetical protein